jgi:KaiC/GvpD/RAD55 family RecA-like ATPase
MKLLRTGIAGLDEFLRGGLPPAVLILLGPLESGNEIFARQIAYARAKDTGITYITFAKPLESVKDDMTAYGWDTSQLEKSGKWKFVKVDQTKQLSQTVRTEMNQHRCIIIDSLSDLLLTQDVEEAISLINTMSAINKETEELHLLLLTQGMQDTRAETAVQHYAEGVIYFNTTWGSELATRAIIIKKMRGTILPPRSLPYTIGIRGFTVETATRIT